jgi:CHASE3 domain sensor protein
MVNKSRLPPVNPRAAQISFTLNIFLAMVPLVIALLAVTVSMIVIDMYRLNDQGSDVQSACDQVLTDLLNAETGQRGYLLTGDPAYLEPYIAAKGLLNTDMKDMAVAPLATPERTVQIEQLRELTAKKIAELAQTIALQEAGRDAAAVALVRTSYGKQTMDAIRTELNAIASANAQDILRLRLASELKQQRIEAVLFSLIAAGLLPGVLLVKHRIDLDTIANNW